MAAAETDRNTDTDNDNDDDGDVVVVVDTGTAAASNDDVNDDENIRTGTISSARFNILSTMVGGGCLSLPLAFRQSGNALVGPLMLLGTGVVTEFCFRLLVTSAVRGKQRPPPPTAASRERTGRDTFESITSDAFGPIARVGSMGLVVLMCFFGTVGYSVLLRDMMEPLNDAIFSNIAGNDNDDASTTYRRWFRKNFTMFAIVVLVTPFCTLRRLTALKDCGAASMLSLLILGTCIVVRSVQCNCNTGPYSDSDHDDDDVPWNEHLRLFPDSWRDVLNAIPLYISCFVCHYNILPVHNELRDPTPVRVNRWLRSTTWFAVALYMVMGFAGSAYAKCTPTGEIQGNILLDFDEGDPLLMVGRMCLAVTITLAFPMLVIPGRDIVIRSLILPRLLSRADDEDGDENENERSRRLREPLLESGNNDGDDDDEDGESPGGGSNDDGHDDEGGGGGVSSVPSAILLSTSVVIFWSAAALASLVSSIDVVWDLLGSSLSILMSYLIPAGTYLVISNRPTPPPNEDEEEEEESGPSLSRRRERIARVVCWLLLGVSVPLMVASTANAVRNTFFPDDDGDGGNR